MATWTNILTSSLEPGQPIRSVDGLALRDNPIAIAEGDPSAPKIWAQAMRYVDFTSSGTFNVPTGCTAVYVECIGGGGSGSGQSATTSQAGGAGSYAAGWVTVTPGGSVTVTVGAGGAGATAGSPGNNGGASSFGSSIVAGGGPGGTTTEVLTGGIATAGQILMQGSRGVFGASAVVHLGGLGLGGRGGGNDGDGTRPGEGGRRPATGTSGAGFRGLVRVWY